jgi:hypothetical protein
MRTNQLSIPLGGWHASCCAVDGENAAAGSDEALESFELSGV